MSLVNKVGNFLFGSNIKPNTGDKHTDSVSHRVYEEGVFQLAQNNYKEALNKLKKASSLGHVSAKYNQALMLFNGLGDYPDFETAKKLFIEAKQAGHTRCDDFINFMREVDELYDEMKESDPMFLVFNEKFMKNANLSIVKMGSAPERQLGNIVYLLSKYVNGKLHNVDYIKAFICHKAKFINLSNYFDLEHLEKEGIYESSFDIELYGNAFDDITTFIDDIFWATVKNDFDLTDLNLEKARLFLVKQVIRYFK